MSGEPMGHLISLEALWLFDPLGVGPPVFGWLVSKRGTTCVWVACVQEWDHLCLGSVIDDHDLESALSTVEITPPGPGASEYICQSRLGSVRFYELV